ncbi:hypothetical protein ACWJKU_01020 [Methylocaldum sp. MU1018]
MVLEAHLITHGLAKRLLQFLGDPRGDATGSDAARLCMADVTGDSATGFKADFRQLSRFTRARFPADYDDLVIANAFENLIFFFGDRKLSRIIKCRNTVRSQSPLRCGLAHQIFQGPELVRFSWTTAHFCA